MNHSAILRIKERKKERKLERKKERKKERKNNSSMTEFIHQFVKRNKITFFQVFVFKRMFLHIFLIFNYGIKYSIIDKI